MTSTLPSKQSPLSSLSKDAGSDSSNSNDEGSRNLETSSLKHVLMAEHKAVKTDLKATTSFKDVGSTSSYNKEEHPHQKTQLLVEPPKGKHHDKSSSKVQKIPNVGSLVNDEETNIAEETQQTNVTNEEQDTKDKESINAKNYDIACSSKENHDNTTTKTSTNTEITKTNNEDSASPSNKSKEDEKTASNTTSTAIATPKSNLPAFIMATATPSLSFAEMLMTALLDEKNNDIMTFLPDKTTFGILKLKSFAKELMNNYFGISTLSSFVRKLKRWGFVRVGDRKTFDMAFYRHPLFKQGDWSTCSKIKSSGRYTKLDSYEESVNTESIMLQTTSFMQAVANAASAKTAATSGSGGQPQTQRLQEQQQPSLPPSSSSGLLQNLNANNKRHIIEFESSSSMNDHDGAKSKKLKTTAERRTSNPTDCLVPAYIESQQRRFSETAETQRRLSETAAAQRRHSADLVVPTNPTPPTTTANHLVLERRLSGLQQQQARRLSGMQGQHQLDQQLEQQLERRLSGMQGHQQLEQQLEQRMMAQQRRLSEVQQRMSSDIEKHDKMAQRRLSDVHRRVSVDSQQQQLEQQMMVAQQRHLSEVQQQVRRRISADNQQQQQQNIMLQQRRRLSEAHRRLSAENQQRYPNRSLPDDIFMAASKSLLRNAATETPATEDALLSDIVLQAAAAAKAERRLSGVQANTNIAAVQHQQALQQVESDMALRAAVADRQMASNTESRAAVAALALSNRQSLRAMEGLDSIPQRRLSNMALQTAMERRMSGGGTTAATATTAAYNSEVTAMHNMGTAGQRRLSAEHQLAMQMEIEQQHQQQQQQQQRRRLSLQGGATSDFAGIPDAASERAALLASGLYSSPSTAKTSALAAAVARNQQQQQQQRSSSIDLSSAASSLSRHRRLSLGVESSAATSSSAAQNLDDCQVNNITKSIVGNALATLKRDGQIQPPKSPTVEHPNAFNHNNRSLLQSRMNMLNASSSVRSNINDAFLG